MLNELIKIQSTLKCNKSQFNRFGNYHYRSCEDILEAVKPLLQKHDCTLTISDELVNIGERYYIKAAATIKNSNGEEETVNAYAREPLSAKGMSDSQITGSASSYARKYALNGMFLIDDNKDADTNAYREQQNYAQEERQAAESMNDKVTKKEAKVINDLCDKFGANKDDVLKYAGVKKFEDMTKTQYVTIFQMLEQKYGSKEKGTIGTK